MRDGGSRLNDFESMGGGKVEEVKGLCLSSTVQVHDLTSSGRQAHAHTYI